MLKKSWRIKLIRKAKRFCRKIGRAIGGWYWPIMVPMTYALFHIGRAAAIAERGNTALGGEVLLLLFPILVQALIRILQDYIDMLKAE